MVDQRPPSFFVSIKNGGTLIFHALMESGHLKGYTYQHPPQPGQGKPCRYNWVDTESGARHKLTFNEQGQATIVGSLKCPQDCGWHVVITDGVAV